jgi:hypothetical protein
MRTERESEPVSAPVFPSRTIPTPRGFRLDLKAAGIEPRDAEGLIVDLHALARVTLATRLSDANVPLVQAQRILRHSDPRLTANVYTKPAASDLRESIERAGAGSRLPSACLERVGEGDTESRSDVSKGAKPQPVEPTVAVAETAFARASAPTIRSRARVAQLDRAADFGSAGCGFESCPGRRPISRVDASIATRDAARRTLRA